MLAASEITLIDLVASQVVLDECTRNLKRLVANESQLQSLEDTLNDIVERSIDVIEPGTLVRRMRERLRGLA